MSEVEKKLYRAVQEQLESLTEYFNSSGTLLPFVEKEKIFSRIDSEYPEGLLNSLLKKVCNEIYFTSISKTRPLKVAYLGPEGTFTGIACSEIFNDSIEKISVKTIPDVFDAVESENATYGVVPVENSTEGAVTYTLDELMETDLNICSEKYIRVSFSLLSRETDHSSIKKIYSHSQSIGQCRKWIRNNFPDVTIETVESNSRAARLASIENNTAAIASSVAAKLYDLNILENSLEDLKHNYTRFFLIGRDKNEPTGNDKTSIVCSVKDQTAALYRLLAPFSEAEINMSRIESRPDKKRMWAYNFFIDFSGHREDKHVKKALERMKEETVFLKILGSYPSGNI